MEGYLGLLGPKRLAPPSPHGKGRGGRIGGGLPLLWPAQGGGPPPQCGTPLLSSNLYILEYVAFERHEFSSLL